jgi:hypothetical protein
MANVWQMYGKSEGNEGFLNFGTHIMWAFKPSTALVNCFSYHINSLQNTQSSEGPEKTRTKKIVTTAVELKELQYRPLLKIERHRRDRQ